jgi:triphosphoribosyl-dephospho-CoA synthase
MAPSSTPFDASRRSLLAARDARQADLDARQGEGWPALVAISLALPGPDKAPPGSVELFRWATGELARTFPAARELHRGGDALGPFAIWGVAEPARRVKERCVAIELAHAAARLVDLDVYAPGGAPVDRASLSMPARACLCCAEPARECIRASRHGSGELASRAASLLARYPLERLASALVDGLRRELWLTPKPGLVDREDCGSHPDLSLALMERSIALVGRYLDELSASVASGEPLARQVTLGLEAERRMKDELGTNTHKGAIFLAGLLVVARHRAGVDDEASVRTELSALAGERATASRLLGTHGEEARRRFGVGGVVREAAAGLPSVFDVAVPAIRERLGRGDADAAAFAGLARLMQVVEDTTALHRCGAQGLARIRADGARLEALVDRDEHLAYLRERNVRYRELNLTMGGVADLLGVSLGWLQHRGELPHGISPCASRPASLDGGRGRVEPRRH